ncbi:ATP-dependent DNA ligase [Candidatus Woesearchaeota archaeon]|nr:ATP-dependent DNA ligase [Candidatus Woesearchaeota archaeon]
MNYEKLIETYDKLEETSKRLEKTYYVSELLKRTSEDDLDKIILLLQGKIYPNTEERKIGVSSKLILKALNISTGIPLNKIEDMWASKGDLGDTAEELTKNKTQRTLFQQKLSLAKVFSNLRKLVEFEGEGTVDKKIKIIAELLTSAEPKEARFISRTVLEDLRLGVGDGVLRDAIAWAFFPKVYGVFSKCSRCERIMPNTKLCLYCANDLKYKFNVEKENYTNLDNLSEDDFIFTESENKAREVYNEILELVQNAYDILNDFSEVALIAKIKGIKGLKDVKLKPLRPLKLMLYPKANGFEDAFDQVGIPAAIEYKYDGFRVQVHKNNDKIKLYTRSSEDVTRQFPDVVEMIEKNVSAKSCILDGEVIGVDKAGKYLAFQNISQRIRRKYDIHQLVKDVPIVLRIFDIVFFDDDNYLNKPFEERRRKISEIIKEDKGICLAEQKIVKTVAEAEAFYDSSLNSGNEGAMMKSLSAPYKPGRKVGYGVKIKPTMDTLDLVVTGAEWGEGKRANWLSSFTIACVDSNGEFLEIGKVGTGFKEVSEDGLSFEEMTKLLKPDIVYEKGKEVKVIPKVVLEIEFEEIQKSPSYNSGYALRFPRVKNLRHKDKNVEEISSLDQVEDDYFNQ